VFSTSTVSRTGSARVPTVFWANARFRPVAAVIIALAALLLLALLKLLALSTPSANTAGHAANRLETGQDT
jgi:hypothetical protein